MESTETLVPVEESGSRAAGPQAWFPEARFGLFIHWGISAMTGRDCWIQSVEQTRAGVYRRHFDHFDPDLFDAPALARRAREAGMKYVVLIAKHHDGFCLWDSQLTDYKVTSAPYGRDVVRAVTDAFRAEGMRVGLYYSLIDLHHPAVTVDGWHPDRDDPAARESNARRDMARYREYLFGQVDE